MNRLDELLHDLDSCTNPRRKVCFYGDTAAYLAAVLRAGRELAEAAEEYLQDGSNFDRSVLRADLNNYDRAVAGTNAGGGDE